MRKGLGLGTGSGYKNMIPKDPSVHSQSAKGIRQPQKIPANVLSFINKNPDAIRKVLEEKHNIKSEKVYSFKDLPKETQEKALDNLRDINVNYGWWDGDGWLGLSQKEMDENKITDEEYLGKTEMFKWKQMYFDLDRGQYLQFDGLTVTNEPVLRKFLGIPQSLWDKVNVNFVNDRERNTQLTFSDKNEDTSYTKAEEEILENAQEKFGDKIHKAWKNMRDTEEDLMSDRAIKETIDANGYKFNTKGQIA